ncbi:MULTISPECIES: hypothetical protein [Mesorhizobium]|nr:MULTISPECIES: hypothetical protein [Mesorhizobium]
MQSLTNISFASQAIIAVGKVRRVLSMRTVLLRSFAAQSDAQLRKLSGPCTLAIEAMKAWSERNVSTGFLIACISTALVWTCSLAIAMLHLVALAVRP